MFTIKRNRSFNPFGRQIGNSFNPFGIEVGKTFESSQSKAYWRSVGSKDLSEERHSMNAVRLAYRRSLESAFVVSLASVILVLQLVRGSGIQPIELQPIVVKIEVEDIPLTRQFRRPPPQARPTVPVPTLAEYVPEDVTIFTTDLDLTEIPPPPAPPSEDEAAIFVAYDTPPYPVGGLDALYENLDYPEIALRAGIEALVLVRILVNRHGDLEDVQILKGSGNGLGFEKAVIAAVHKLEWRPAMQRDRAVKVWVTIPVQFKRNANVPFAAQS